MPLTTQVSMIAQEDMEVYCQYFNQLWLIVKNYDSEDYPYGEKGVTFCMYTLLEYSRPNHEAQWKKLHERDYDLIDEALNHFEHRLTTFLEASKGALVDHRSLMF